MEENKWLKSYTVATWVMAFFTIVIAMIGCLQYRMYRDSERPWLGSRGERGIDFEVGTNKIRAFVWGFVNGGKSPARNIRFDLAMKIGAPIPKDAGAIKAPAVQACDDTLPLPGERGGLALPGIKQNYMDLATQDIQDSSDSIHSNKLGLYFVGCMDYTGASGADYRTWVCEYFAPNAKEFRPCLSGNSAQ